MFIIPYDNTIPSAEYNHEQQEIHEEISQLLLPSEVVTEFYDELSFDHVWQEFVDLL